MFNREEKKLANLIFYGSRACAIESYIPFLEKFPALEKLDNKREGLENDWDFYLTIAIAIYAIPIVVVKNGFKESRIDKLNAFLLEEIKKWNNEAEAAVEHLVNFLKTNFASTNELETHLAFGAWATWNLIGESSNEEQDLELANGVGNLIKSAGVRF